MCCLLNEHAGHRLAASAVVVDETTGGTSDFPHANRNRSSSGVCCGFVAAFDGKAVAAFVAREPVVPAGFSHGSSLSAMTNSASARGEAVGHDLPLDHPPSGARSGWRVLHHFNPRSR